MTGEEVLGMLIVAQFVGLMWMFDRYITQPLMAVIEERAAASMEGRKG